MNFNFLYKSFVFAVLFSFLPVFGMRYLAKLSLEEAAELWRGGALTIIHKIEIKHNHRLVRDFSNIEPIQFDRTGEYILLNCKASEKKLIYSVMIDLAKHEEIDYNNKKIDFIPSNMEWINYGYECGNPIIDWTFTAYSRDDTIAFGYISKGEYDDKTKKYRTDCHDIGVYDVLYKHLLFRLPIKRTEHCNLAVKQNSSMIATNLDDGKDTIVILYPQLLNFLKYKNYYDINLILN